ncbi:hypothetical protein F4677DRAFT_442643 [Hypoxylon crocopeplum]|nr:hypothetical protein F4677DRAFT_442643 [Hypoxylon crocopeplum]
MSFRQDQDLANLWRPPRAIQRGTAPKPPSLGGGMSGRTLKRVIWTGAFAAVAIVGAIYGAGLKTQHEYQQEKQKVVEASADDRIRGLEERRAALVTQRAPLEKKLGEIRARIKARDLENAAAAATAATSTAESGNKK